MRALLGAVLLLSLLLRTSSSRSAFFGYVSDDTMAYTRVPVSSTAQRVVIYLWGEPTSGSESQRQAIIGINRIPTIGSYDSIFALPPNGEIISIIDDSPVDSILYIGLWGGKMLHSYRYFGGSPRYTSVAVVADIVQCDTAAQQGFTCTVYPQIPTMQTSNYISDGRSISQQSTGKTTVLLPLGSRSSVVRRLSLLAGQDRVQLTLRSSAPILNKLQVTELCNALDVNASHTTGEVNVRIRGQLYLERQPDNVHIVYSDALLNRSTFCSSGEGGSSSSQLIFQDLFYDLVKPLPGYWTLALSLHMIEGMDSAGGVTSSGSSIGVIIEPTAQEEVDSPGCLCSNKEAFESRILSAATRGDNCRIRLVGNVQLSAFERPIPHHFFASANSQITQVMDIDDTTIQLNVSIEVVNYFCAHGFISSSNDLSVTDCAENIYDMNSYSSQDTATFQYTLDSDDHLITVRKEQEEIKAENNNVTSQEQNTVMLRGNLEGMNFSPAGGTMSIEVTFSPAEEAVGGGLLQGDAFSVYVQTGNFAHVEEASTVAAGSILSNRQVVMSSNWLQLNLSNADESDTVMSSQNRLVTRKFRWVYHKPRLGDLIRLLEGDYCMFFYIFMKNYHGTVPSVTDDEGGEKYKVNLRVVFSPCLESICKHGQCVVSDDGLLVSSCSCRYPYAGEFCGELAEPYLLYIMKVLILVLSNFAVFPGAILAFQKNDPVLGCVLTSSGVASIFYHLCDCDIWCIGGLSFQSLQVLDVLFATSSMSAVLIHHYPLQRESRSALSLSLLAFLVAPVSNSPTDALCIILAMGGGTVLFVVFWLRFWLLSPCGTGERSVRDAKTKTYLEITSMESGSGDSGSVSTRKDSGAVDIALGHSSEELILNRPTDRDIDDTAVFSDIFESQMGSLMTDDTSSSADAFYEERAFGQTEKKSLGTYFYRCHHHCSNIFLTLVGFFMVIVAFSCYIFQTRETYWIVHSLWHLLAMGSTFFFIKNKDSTVIVLSKFLRTSK